MWISIIVICIIGTMGHFMYEISRHNKVVALFAAVNESTWEHIKIALTPMFLMGLIDGFKYGTCSNYFVAKAISLLIIIFLIPIIFYSYSSITKKAILPIDILTFYVTITCAQLAFYKIIKIESLGFIYNYLSLILIFVIFGFYMSATMLPMKNFLFKDPNSKKYGIKGHTEMDADHKH